MKTDSNYLKLQNENKLLKEKLTQLEYIQHLFQNNNSFLRLLLDTIPSPVFYKDNKGIYQHCNDAFSKTILGIPKEKIIGKSLYDLPEVIPSKLADIYYEKDKELFEKPTTQFYEAKVLCSDKKERYFNFYKASLLSEKNEIIGLVGVMLDVSDYKESQKQLEKKNKELKELSSTDPLTKLYNRRFFEKIFEEKLSSLNRNKKSFALALLDIDFFKDYNDGFGHLEGDIALKEISLLLYESMKRTSDYVFRIGGEEFAILFDSDSFEKANSVLKKINKAINEKKLKTYNKEVSEYLTVSIGLGFIKTQNFEKENKKKIYNDVDYLLYESKKNGRNKITSKEY
ncbi:diguanylate cyclase [Arcobacter sp. YIC-464]|uniref:GGDEF domain-containing protein n=1 Tax=Arcobacter sp. YIC-464 TaxID=3376631 RepID=UPI003C1C62BF